MSVTLEADETSTDEETFALADQAKQSEDEAIEMIAERIVGRSVDH